MAGQPHELPWRCLLTLQLIFFCFRDSTRDLRPKPSFTNCIVTLYWADGVNRTPSVLFTYNTLFHTAASWKATSVNGRRVNITKLRHKNIEHLQDMMWENGITEDRVIVLPRPSSRSRTSYCRESAQIVEKFFSIYSDVIPKESVIFRDAGECFTKVDTSSEGLSRVEEFVEYEPLVHEFLSPNDNPLHGAAKRSWRLEGGRQQDDVASSLLLLNCLDRAGESEVKQAFATNFFLGNKKRLPTIKEVEEFLGSRRPILSHRLITMQNAQKQYAKFMQGKSSRGQEVHLVTPENMDCNLDGDYWTTFS